MQYHDADRVKNDARDYTVTCFQCGQSFEATRSDASFCSAKCRVAYSREPQKFKNALEAVNGMAANLLTTSRKYKKSSEMYEAFIALRRDLDAAIGNFENED